MTVEAACRRRRRSARPIASGVAIVLLLLPRTARGAAGDLDTTFGSGGLVSTNAGRAYATASAVRIQDDGSLVVAGFAAPASGEGCDTLVARYDGSGSLDPGFGSGGIVLTDLAECDRAFAAALEEDGKIVTAGQVASGTASDFAILRFNPDGTPDMDFGTGGVVTTDFGAEDLALGVALQADGKIVAVGGMDTGTGGQFAVARYATDGTLDASFGVAGVVTTPLTGRARAYAVAIQPDGGIVVGGISNDGPNTTDFALVRYDTDGNLDPGFGAGGIVETDFGGEDDLHALALQPDGKIVVAGAALDTTFFALARYAADGSLDTAFGAAGKTLRNVPGTFYDLALALALQADGGMIAGGTGNVEGFALVRLTPDGLSDPDFGGCGAVDTPGPEEVFGLAVQDDGRIVAAGASFTTLVMARYLGGPVGSGPCALEVARARIVPARVGGAAAKLGANGSFPIVPPGAPLDCRFGLDVQVTDSTSFVASHSWPLEECDGAASGRIRCRSGDRLAGFRARTSSPGRQSFSLRLRGLSAAMPAVAPVTVRITDRYGADRGGAIASCDTTSSGMLVCR
jgi:uncharacterized delta-60 repeat protein